MNARTLDQAMGMDIAAELRARVERLERRRPA
jgi:hypothetical protein